VKPAAGAARLPASGTRSEETALWEDILCPGVLLIRSKDQVDEKDVQVTLDPNSVNHVSIGKSWIPR